jgi:hypothetical protein
MLQSAGAYPGFQVRGARLKKLRRAEGGAKIFGIFRVKNHGQLHTTDQGRIQGGGAHPAPAPPPARAPSKIGKNMIFLA